MKIHTLLCPSALGVPLRNSLGVRRARLARGWAAPCSQCLAGAEALLASKGTFYPAKVAGPSRDAVLASDVVFELFDDELLLDNYRLDEIANRDEADQPPAVQDRQVANPPLGYDAHAFLNALV